VLQKLGFTGSYVTPYYDSHLLKTICSTFVSAFLFSSVMFYNNKIQD